MSKDNNLFLIIDKTIVLLRFSTTVYACDPKYNKSIKSEKLEDKILSMFIFYSKICKE